MNTELFVRLAIGTALAGVTLFLIKKIINWYSRAIVGQIIKEEKAFFEQTKVILPPSPQKNKQKVSKNPNPWFKPSRS